MRAERWNPSMPLRWGDRQATTVLGTGVPTPIDFVTGELVRVEADIPAVWKVRAQFEGIAVADLPTLVIELILRIGIGSFTVEERIAFRAPPFTVDVPAQWLSCRLRVSGLQSLGGVYSFDAWAGPLTHIGGRFGE